MLLVDLLKIKDKNVLIIFMTLLWWEQYVLGQETFLLLNECLLLTHYIAILII